MFTLEITRLSRSGLITDINLCDSNDPNLQCIFKLKDYVMGDSTSVTQAYDITFTQYSTFLFGSYLVVSDLLQEYMNK